MRALVSGLINIETTLRVRAFPIHYYPIDYPFFGIKSDIVEEYTKNNEVVVREAVYAHKEG